MPTNYLFLCHPLFLLPSIFPSIRVFSNESVLHISPVQFSYSVMSDSLQPQGMQHARPPCPSPTSRVYQALNLDPAEPPKTKGRDFLRTAAHQASLSITNSRSLPKLMSIELVMPSNHLILCRPLLLPAIFPSIRVFSNESVPHIRWPKYWSFSFNIGPSNEYLGLIYP